MVISLDIEIPFEKNPKSLPNKSPRVPRTTNIYPRKILTTCSKSKDNTKTDMPLQLYRNIL